MKKFNKMSKKEIKALNDVFVICVYSDFYEKTCNEAFRDRDSEKVPFPLIAIPYGEWRTDGNLIICRDSVCKYLEGGKTDPENMVIVTEIYKRV